MKKSVLVVVAVLLVLSQAHKRNPVDEDMRPIYQPFDDVPTPQQEDTQGRDGLSDEEKQKQTE